jgi:hypothetical protein
MSELGDKLRTAIEPVLQPGEELRGVSVATQASMFKGRMVGIGITDHRLILQGVDRKFEPNCEPISLPPERIADAKAEGAGGGWADIGSALMDGAAVTLKLKTTDGEKFKLMMMRGTGPLGGLGGGEDQRQGVEALGAWFGEHATG